MFQTRLLALTELRQRPGAHFGEVGGGALRRTELHLPSQVDTSDARGITFYAWPCATTDGPRTAHRMNRYYQLPVGATNVGTTPNAGVSRHSTLGVFLRRW